MTEKSASGGAMGFFHNKGFVASYRQAVKYAGVNGRVGTLLDVVDARLTALPQVEGHVSDYPTPWDEYYTTMSAEYLGVSKGGTKILIVAHGIGPMATERGVVEAYRWEFDDKSRNRRGGRITIEEFHKLESGHFGPVEIVEFEPYLKRYTHPFISILRATEAMGDPVIRARLGAKAPDYILRHLQLAFQYYERVYCIERLAFAREHKSLFDPFIIKSGDAGNCSYQYRQVEEGYAFAHLLTMGQINCVSGSDYGRLPTWSCEVDPYEWWHGTRLFGVREGSVATIGKGPDARKLLRKHWRELFEPSGLKSAPDGLFVLMQMQDKTWFTQCEKKGASADTYEPEFRVTSIEEVGGPQRFYTSSNYPVPIFRYERREATSVLPHGANAYRLLGDPGHASDGSDRDTCLVQGYRIEIDHTKRLVRQDKLADDFDRMMALA